ncbi:MAG: histidine kinase, partial [Aliifodinibius sp.]|nr:histidine kinase [Fodinibius sp.]
KIAGELHDRIVQNLNLAKLRLGEIQEIISHNNLNCPINEINGLISQTIEDIRSLIFEISPPILQELGFNA